VYTVDVLARGRAVVAQDGRQAVLEPGDLAPVDLSRPVHWATPGMQAVAVVSRGRCCRCRPTRSRA
jgi:hypothetical protein